jgi:hypothetical protein
MRAASIIIIIITVMMEAVNISETSAYYNETARRYIPEVSHLQTRGRENLKSHKSRQIYGLEKK